MCARACYMISSIYNAFVTNPLVGHISYKGVQKTEILFGFGYKKNPNRIRTVQKFDIRADGFPTETACNPQFISSDKNNFTCVQCADKERFKTRPKPSLAYRL